MKAILLLALVLFGCVTPHDPGIGPCRDAILSIGSGYAICPWSGQIGTRDGATLICTCIRDAGAPEAGSK
jgi:hypothetical protein